ncbi:MAG: hypothetical protein GKS06_05185 [Acidobacteria bacterium]|nr:hypothetical protein [Acidobacteriota bacterium]
MLSTVSERTRGQIENLTRDIEVEGVSMTICPCRLIPETVLNLKTLMREIELMWRETLGDDVYETLVESNAGAAFFAGDTRLVEVQEGRPKMVGVWMPIPPDYPERLKVQLIDAVEPFEFP